VPYAEPGMTCVCPRSFPIVPLGLSDSVASGQPCTEYYREPRAGFFCAMRVTTFVGVPRCPSRAK